MADYDYEEGDLCIRFKEAKHTKGEPTDRIGGSTNPVLVFSFANEAPCQFANMFLS